MKSFLKGSVVATAYFFSLLFIYAAASKIFDFQTFQVQLAQSPLLSAYAGFIPAGVIVLEVSIAVVLFFPKVRAVGLYAALSLMNAFTVYIYLLLRYSDSIPCSCGGILENMEWEEHLIFNLCCVGAALAAILISKKGGSVPFRRSAAMGSLIILISAGGMVALFLFSEYVMKKANNFTRRYISNPVTEEATFNLDVNSYYFAGFDGNHVYLGNSTAPFQFFTLDFAFQKFNTVTIQPDRDFKFRNPKIKVSDGQLFFYDGTVPVIYTGERRDFSGKVKTRSFKNVYYDQLAIIDSARYYFTALSSNRQDRIVGSLQTGEHPSVVLKKDILVKVHDGIFDTDGRIMTDEKNKNIYYVHYYSNKILKLNLNQSNQFTMHTIDPVSVPDIPIVKLKDGTRKMTAPPPTINRSMTVYGGLLFNESPRLGKSEQRSFWNENFIIDVYRLYSAEYLGSFHLPKTKGRSLQMLVTDQHLFVLTDTKIIKYRLEKPLKNNFQ